MSESDVVCLVAKLCPTLRPHGLQRAELPCPSLSPSLLKLMSIDSLMLSDHLILCCLLLLLPSIFPSIRVFSSELAFCIRCQSIEASASASVLSMNSQDWFPLEWTGWISFQSEGLSRVFSKSKVQKHQFFDAQHLHSPTLTSVYDYWKNHRFLTIWTFVSKVMPLLFNMLSRIVIAFLPRSKCLFISWLQSPSAVILEPEKIKSVIVSIVSPSICHEVMGVDAMILVTFLLAFLIPACASLSPAFYMMYSAYKLNKQGGSI